MPLIEHVRPNTNCAWALWKIEESSDELLQHLSLMPDEFFELESLKSEIRRVEFLTNRVLTRFILESFSLNYPGVYKDEFNKPHLQNDLGFVSFSHTTHYAAVIFSTISPVGIDVEMNDERAYRIRKKFLDETELISFGDKPENAVIAWSLKESLYKIWGRKQLDFRENLKIWVDNAAEGSYLGEICKDGLSQKHRLSCKRYNDCVLSVNIN
jgi:4'-phosphopantetheinyl transferase